MSGSCQKCKIIADMLPQTSATINSDEIFNSCDIIQRKELSCWDEIDPEWLEGAEEDIGNRIYVHGIILEWLVQHINENILNAMVRATVEEVHHHNLDGPVYLIKFYRYSSNPEYEEALLVIKNRLKYRMAWRTNPTFFLRMDSGFEGRKTRIISDLQELNLHDSFKVMALDVKWLYIPKIEIYEFSDNLTQDQVEEIDLMFLVISESQASIYICDQFKWHYDIYIDDYIDVDKLAMDICAEEWRSYDLLKDFSVDDVLNLDLANKDYRDPYFNEYLNRYLDILLKKSLPQLSTEHDEKLEFPINRLNPFLQHYFVSKFYDRISVISNTWDFKYLGTAYDIPIITRQKEIVILEADRPPPDTILMMQCDQIEYHISNYTQFSDPLFRALLNKSNEWQLYKIRFDQEFNFLYESDKQFSQHLSFECNWTVGFKTIIIELEQCTERNAEKLAIFVTYLINLFNERHKLDEQISISFSRCILDDYSFLENIGNKIVHIKLQRMKFSTQQLKVLSRALTQQRIVSFVDCEGITDDNVMTILENINFNHLTIEGTTACTYLVYYLLAEHLMRKEDVDIIEADRFEGKMIDWTEDFNFNFGLVDFLKNGDQIVVQNRLSKEFLDLYCLINDFLDESFDPSNNIYNE